MSLLYIYKLTDNYYQIIIGDDDYYREAIKHVNLKYLLSNVKYLKNDETIINRYTSPKFNDVKGKYLFKFDIRYNKYDKYNIYTIYSCLGIRYEKDNDVIKFTNNLIKALKDLSTNDDFDVKRINELKKIEISESPNITQYFNACEEIKYINCPKNILFIKTDLDIETIYNLVEYDCLEVRVSTKYRNYYIKDDYIHMLLKSKIKFNDRFEGLLYVDNIKMYIKTDEDKLIKLLSKLTNIECENYKNYNDIIKLLEDIKSQSEDMINKFQYKQINEVKNKIKSKLENIDNIEILNEILNKCE